MPVCALRLSHDQQRGLRQRRSNTVPVASGNHQRGNRMGCHLCEAWCIPAQCRTTFLGLHILLVQLQVVRVCLMDAVTHLLPTTRRT